LQEDHLLLAGSSQLLQIVNNSPNEEMIEKNWPGAAVAGGGSRRRENPESPGKTLE
jgi:hypothetical protein